MTLEDNLEKKLKELGEAVGSDESMIKNVMTRIEQAESQPKSIKLSWIRRFTMSRFAKLAVAAAIIITAVVLLKIPSTFVPTAYALQDTIEAGNSIRFLHIKASSAEIWLQYNEFGDIIRIRFQSPHLGDAVGPIVVVGNYDESESWLPRFNLHITGHGNPGSVFGFDVSRIEPRVFLERLRQQQEQGEIILDINEPGEKNEPIVVTVTYPKGHRSWAYKKVLYVDQATKLVTRLEKYKLENGQYRLKGKGEFLDYNQQIDAKMFSLEGEVPAAAKVLEMPDVEAGLAQGDMTDEEIAVEVVRQFFEAVIAKDYDRAGLLYMAAPGFMVEQAFMGANLIEITEIGEARRDPDPDSDAMITSCKVIAEFGGQYYEIHNKWMKVQRFGDGSARWMITGNWTSVNPVPGTISISKDNVSLDAVTYYGLTPGEFMKKWLVLGPLPYPLYAGEAYFGTEEGQRLAFGRDTIDFLNFTPEVNIDNIDYEWGVLESEYGNVDLTQLNEEKNDFQTVYLWAQIDVPEETKGTLGIGSDDGVKVWLNDELLHENWLYRGVVTDNDRVPVTFKKGKNQLVLKIQNAMGPWGFCCRLMEQPSGKLSISRGEADLDAATYYGLEHGEFMQKWLILDPIAIAAFEDGNEVPNHVQEKHFNADQIDVTEFEPVMNIAGQDHSWSILENSNRLIDLTSEFGDEPQITYVWAQIDMPEEKQVVLGIGSDDGVKVWLNGELVHKNWTCRGVMPDNDRVWVTFKEGKNQLVLKIQNWGGPWGFCCRVLGE